MYDYHILFAGLGITLELYALYRYIHDIVLGTTKPHAFTWFAWFLINAIVASAQIISGGGIGASVTVVVAFFCFSIFLAALFHGEKDIKRSDWICFIGSLLAIALWTLTRNALSAVAIVTFADALAFVPTFRKAYSKPFEETPTVWSVGVFRGICTIIALRSLTLVNWLYPGSLILTDGAFWLLLFVRRRQLDRP